MKVLTAAQLREADAYTIEHEPISSTDLMERAATRMFDWLMLHYKKPQAIKIFCGTGNNGGDGLVLARLFQDSWHDVMVHVVRYSEDSSEDFKHNEQRLRAAGIPLIELNDGDNIPEISNYDVVIDALFGTGLTRPVKGYAAKIIEEINRSHAEVVAIDMPSGLFSERHPDQKGGAVVQANITLTIEAPKLSLVLPDTGRFAGDWKIIRIGLHPKALHSFKTAHYLLSDSIVGQAIWPRPKFGHKGTFGHALMIAGSHGKVGAAILASRAVLRAGAGLVTTHVPACAYEIMQASVPEAMCSVDQNETNFTHIKELQRYQSIGIGPGLGMHERTHQALKVLIQEAQVPLVLDADALNILGEHKTWVSYLPAGSILTPHPRELSRLIGSYSNDADRLSKLTALAVKHRIFVLMKGAHTAIACPDGAVYFNSTGNPGMATAGSGDVLTGIITGLMAQGLESRHAALVGVYLHGLAGDLAAKKRGVTGLIASDIIEHLPLAFKQFDA